MGLDADVKSTPLLTIQCDWDDALRLVNGEAWITCKFKDQAGKHGTLRCTKIGENGAPVIVGTEGFKVEYVAKDAIRVQHTESSFVTIFLAPSKVYSDIHKKSIVSLDVTAGGLSISVCTENNLRIWDFNRGELKLNLTGHVGDVYKCRFFPSGVVVLSGGADMQLKIWCAETGKCPATLAGHSMAINDVAIVDRGRNIISVSKDGTAKLWDCGESACLGDLAKVSSAINCCSISVAHSSLTLGQPKSAPREREVGTENKVLLLGCEDGTVHCIAVRSRTSLFTLSFASAVNSVIFLSDSYFVVGCHDGEIHMYSIENTKQAFKTWFESNSAVLSMLPYKEKGFFSSHADGSVVYRHVSNEMSRLMLTGPDCDPVYEVVSDGRFIFTCSRDSQIRRYNVEKIISKYF